MAGTTKPKPPEPPRHLSAQARELWRTLHKRIVFEEHERTTLRLALEALDRAATARRKIERLGMTYDDRFGQPHARPEVAIERDARLAWVRLMAAIDLPADPAQPKDMRGRFAPKEPGRLSLAEAAERG